MPMRILFLVLVFPLQMLGGVGLCFLHFGERIGTLQGPFLFTAGDFEFGTVVSALLPSLATAVAFAVLWKERPAWGRAVLLLGVFVCGLLSSQLLFVNLEGCGIYDGCD